MKNKGVQQLHVLPQNSEAIDIEKLHAIHQVGMWWHAITIHFRTLYSFLSFTMRHMNYN